MLAACWPAVFAVGCQPASAVSGRRGSGVSRRSAFAVGSAPVTVWRVAASPSSRHVSAKLEPPLAVPLHLDLPAGGHPPGQQRVPLGDVPQVGGGGVLAPLDPALPHAGQRVMPRHLGDHRAHHLIVNRRHRGVQVGAGEPGSRQEPEPGLGEGEGVRAQVGPDGQLPQGPPVAQQHRAGAAGQPGQPAPPVGLVRVGPDLAEHPVERQLQHVVLGADVPVQRPGRHPEIGGDPAHRQAPVPLGVQHGHGRADDLVAAELAVARRPLVAQPHGAVGGG